MAAFHRHRGLTGFEEVVSGNEERLEIISLTCFWGLFVLGCFS